MHLLGCQKYYSWAIGLGEVGGQVVVDMGLGDVRDDNSVAIIAVAGAGGHGGGHCRQVTQGWRTWGDDVGVGGMWMSSSPPCAAVVKKRKEEKRKRNKRMVSIHWTGRGVGGQLLRCWWPLRCHHWGGGWASSTLWQWWW